MDDEHIYYLNVLHKGEQLSYEDTKKFLEFLSEKKAQSIFAEANFEYPVNKKAQLSNVVKSWGTFKIDALSFDEIGKNASKAQFLADEAGWK